MVVPTDDGVTPRIVRTPTTGAPDERQARHIRLGGCSTSFDPILVVGTEVREGPVVSRVRRRFEVSGLPLLCKKGSVVYLGPDCRPAGGEVRASRRRESSHRPGSSPPEPPSDRVTELSVSARRETPHLTPPDASGPPGVLFDLLVPPFFPRLRCDSRTHTDFPTRQTRGGRRPVRRPRDSHKIDPPYGPDRRS